MISLMIIYSRYAINNSLRNINNLRYADDTILMAESEEELKSLLMRVKEESQTAGLKLNIQKIMASSPITSWYRKGEKVEAVTDFIFLGSKITSDGDCSHKIKRHLLLGRKTMTNIDSILKSREIALLTKWLAFHIVRAMVFPVVMYRCESWTIKKAEDWKNWCFQIWGLEKILESPSDYKMIKPVCPKGNQPWIFTGKTNSEAEAPIFWPPDAKSLFIGKDPDAGKDWRHKKKRVTEDEIVRWHHQLNGHEFEEIPGNTKGQESLECCRTWVAKSWTQFSNWTTTQCVK